MGLRGGAGGAEFLNCTKVKGTHHTTRVMVPRGQWMDNHTNYSLAATNVLAVTVINLSHCLTEGSTINHLGGHE